MEIRYIEKKDAHQKSSIMRYCFEGKDSESKPECPESFVPENHIGLFAGDKLMSSLEMMPKEIIMYEKAMKMGGIGGVTSFPEYRYGGMAKKLIIRSLEILRDREILISFLKPFSYSYYRKYGWETSFHKKYYTIQVPSLRSVGMNTHAFKRLNHSDIPDIKSIYKRYMLQYNGCVIRTNTDWKSKFLGRFIYGAIDEKGCIKGYLIYSISDGAMHIDELVCDDISSKRDLLQFVYRHDSQINEVMLTAAPDDLTDLILDNPPKTEYRYKMMARVVDILPFLKSYDYGTFEGEFCINIEDPWATWNNKTFKVQAKNSTVTVSETSLPADISLSIEAFSQMVMGYAGFSKQLYMQKVKHYNADKKSAFENIFPDRKTDLCDFF